MAKILIVDDQRNMRTTLSMMLRGAGYEVDEAADGEQGAERGATGAYDVVLTDLRMGTKDGTSCGPPRTRTRSRRSSS
jgi:two-component system, NtrC family, response regulator HydG